MPKLIVNGSSSSGNQYAIVADNGETLLLEAGLPFSSVLRSIGYRRSKIVGCCISHKHSDHAGHVNEYKGFPKCSPEKQQAGRWYRIGTFQVFPFSVEHDVPCFGYIIKHPDFGSILFATDCMNIPTIFKGIDWYLIEANYSDAILNASNTDPSQKRRIITSHMSLEYCTKYLHECDAESAEGIILVHLSDRHSDETEFKRSIESEFAVPCTIADKGVVIDISKELL